ncbi:MAG: hypothetical protein AAFP81_07205 [Pseudomonadota bacterium]
MIGSYPSRFLAAALLLLICSITFVPEATASYALEDWNMEARRNMPLVMKIWLGAMLLTNLAAVFFVRKHVAARWVLGAWLFSHAWIAIVEGTGVYTVQGGLVSLGHIIVWAPAIYALYRYRAEIKLPSVYGIWASLMLFFYGVSLIFDVRDAFIWLSANLF